MDTARDIRFTPSRHYRTTTFAHLKISTMPKLRTLLFLLLTVFAGLAFAQDGGPARALGSTRQAIDAIRDAAKAEDIDGVKIDAMRANALDAQSAAQGVSSSLQSTKEAAKARLDQLGPVPTTGKESPEIASQRRDAQKAFDAVDSQIKQADGMALEAQQLAGQMAEMKRTRFQERISQRTNSPFSKPFWTEPAQKFPRDWANLRALGADVRSGLAAAVQPDNRLPFFLCVPLGLLILSVGRWLIERTVFRLTADRMPAGRLRRSAMAVAIVVSSMLTAGIGMQMLYKGINWNGTLSDDADALARSLASMVMYGAGVAGLGRALLARSRPSWRLPAISDAAVEGLYRLPVWIAIFAVLSRLIEVTNTTIGASLASTVVSSCLRALVLSALIGMGLIHLSRTHRIEEDGSAPPPRPLWASLLIAAASIGVVLTWLSVLTGYIAFASFLAGQMVWTLIVVAATYLAMRLVDDLCETLLSSKGPMSARAQSAFGMDPNVLDQAGVLLSGVARLTLFLFAMTALLSRFGAGPTELLAMGGKLETLKIGNAVLAPDKIVGAIGIFLLGLLAVRVVKNWLSEQLLPRTNLDPGMRTSLTTLLGYVGGVVVFTWALYSMGVGLNNIAWIASALSVGIGFGLQAIVQNFISGLILLAERPVKVGDWVVLDDAEGDIRRINVRATEIQMGDRSTVIVPNSSFITKPVRNMTLSNPQGRVQLKLPMPLDTDPAAAREHMLEAMKAHAAVQASPAPIVQLDSIDRTAMMFVATAYVGSPRDVGNVRSDLLFDVLARLREADIPLLRPQDLVLRSSGNAEGTPPVPGPQASTDPISS
jgi:small-conductance mechanosensitive channel